MNEPEEKEVEIWSDEALSVCGYREVMSKLITQLDAATGIPASLLKEQKHSTAAELRRDIREQNRREREQMYHVQTD